MRVLLKILLLCLLAAKPLTCSSAVTEIYPGEAKEELIVHNDGAIFGAYQHDTTFIFAGGKSIDTEPPQLIHHQSYSNAFEQVVEAYKADGAKYRTTTKEFRPSGSFELAGHITNMTLSIAPVPGLIVDGTNYWTTTNFWRNTIEVAAFIGDHDFSVDVDGMWIGFSEESTMIEPPPEGGIPERNERNANLASLYDSSKNRTLFSSPDFRNLGQDLVDPPSITLDPDFEFESLNLTCISIWQNYPTDWTITRMATLVSPSCAVSISHGKTYYTRVGDKVAFAGASGTVYVREVSAIHFLADEGIETDIHVLVLDSPLPSDVTPALLPDNKNALCGYTGLTAFNVSKYREVRLGVLGLDHILMAYDPIYSPLIDTIYGVDTSVNTNCASLFNNATDLTFITGDSASPLFIPEGTNVVVIGLATMAMGFPNSSNVRAGSFNLISPDAATLIRNKVSDQGESSNTANYGGKSYFPYMYNVNPFYLATYTGEASDVLRDASKDYSLTLENGDYTYFMYNAWYSTDQVKSAFRFINFVGLDRSTTLGDFQTNYVRWAQGTIESANYPE